MRSIEYELSGVVGDNIRRIFTFKIIVYIFPRAIINNPRKIAISAENPLFSAIQKPVNKSFLLLRLFLETTPF